MSNEIKNESVQATDTEDKQEKNSSTDIDTQAEAAEEKKVPERPGTCCGSCS